MLQRCWGDPIKVALPLFNSKHSYRDVRELITTVTEYNQGQTLQTSYSYDALKQITAVLDDHNNRTTIQYDNLGRRTAIDNPDTGRVETVYDLASNPVQKITAVLRLNHQAIHYDYDQNRLIAVHYPNNPGNDVSYTYGGNTPQARQYNQVGRVVKITSQAGSEERQYGKLGETTQETKTVSSHTQGANPNSPEVYTTKYDFDTFGRLMLLTLPDGEIITHRYDSGGNVDHIEGAKNGQITAYLQALLYDKFEQRTYVKLGNGVETHYTYRADNRRLANLDSTGTAAGHFQNLDYKYDKVGNITDLANNVAIPAPNSFGGPTSQHFGYDDLYRLTHADGNFKYSPGKARDYKLDLVYDTIHNITNKTQTDTLSSSGNKGIPQKGTTYDWDYTYTPQAQPHAPAHIGDRTFYYDANGNQTGWSNDKNGTKRTITWDEDNRIQEISDNGSTTDFKYDDQGQRVFKIGKQGETVYVNQFFVVRNRSIVSKHVFAGTSRLATKLETGNGNTNIRSQGTAPSGQASGTSQAAAGQASAEIENKLITETEGDTTLPGNSEEGLENALANGKGKGNKKGIYKRLDKLGYEVDANGQIVPQEGGTTTGSTGQSPTLFLYYYHPDHLGSTGYVTDANGKLYEHIEYFPFGETWVQQSSNTQRTPYLFTGKELDEETGLYYFGARYYDPRTSVWQSADPILEKYLPGKDEIQRRNSGDASGVYDPFVMSLYAYGHLGPLTFKDPDGRDNVAVVVGAKMSTTRNLGHRRGGAYQIYQYKVFHVPSWVPNVAKPLVGKLFGKKEGEFELTWEARSSNDGNRGTVLGDSSKLAEVSLGAGKHPIRVTDIDKSAKDVLTQETSGGTVTRENVRLHWGGPSGSEGCGTTCDLGIGMSKSQTETHLQGQMKLNEPGEKHFIVLPPANND
jgi:RHS repeat-associated protein